MNSQTSEIERQPRGVDRVTFGSLTLDADGYAVSVNGADIALTYAEFLLLNEFARHPYQALDRRRLATLIRENLGGTDGASSSLRSVDTHIARLRAKLRRADYDCIKTMRFVGYRFVPLA
jgi:DNA-binding response OmpR family regulator